MTAKTKLPREHYTRVSRSRPCPVCGKPDWCMLARDGSHAICSRVSIGGVFCGEPGWRHLIGNVQPTTHPTMREKAKLDASGYAVAFERALTVDQRTDTAASLGVTPGSLYRLRMGWCEEHDAPTFPMWERGQIVGIRIRKPDGSKFAIRDSSNGFFIPRGLTLFDTLLIVEGPTDCAAALDLGFDAIGKPNASACSDELIRLLCERRPDLTVFVGENDTPDASGKVAGIDGPMRQCERAKNAGLRAVFILPPKGKDLREWKNVHGATHDMVERIVRNAT